jgi:hypothetical protein
VVTGRGLQELELPQDVMSLLYASSSRGNSKRRQRSGPHTVKKLIFSHNNISTFVTSQLSLFRNVIHLDLSFNAISSFQGDFPPNLEVLRLKKNEIQRISGLLLCMNLRSLDLSHNKIRSIDGLPSELERLDLSFNAIAGDMNLRMLSLCPKVTAIAIQGNPVMSKLKGSCKARLLSLLPKLKEINHSVLPRARRSPKEPSHMPLPHESFIWPDSPKKKSRQEVGTASPGRARSPKRRRAVSKKRQEEGDLRRFHEAEELQKSREKLEAQLAQTFQKMHNAVTKKKSSMKANEIAEMSSRLNTWRPWHIKKREEEEVKLSRVHATYNTTVGIVLELQLIAMC